MPDHAPVHELIGRVYTPLILSRDDLLTAGWKPRMITRAVREGSLRRLRRDRYAAPDLPAPIMDAVRAGGRLCCVSLLQLLGLFVLESDALHLRVQPNASRLPRRREGVRRHWASGRPDDDLAHVVSVPEAVLQAVRCQNQRSALATLDSVVHHRVMTPAQLEHLFAHLPRRYRVLLRLVDGSAESGAESFLRLILRALGLSFETQVMIPGVGRVDFLVEGWLIIECDSRSFHEGWAVQKRDRERDMTAAASGYVTIRPIAEDIFRRPDRVREQIAGVVTALRPVRGRRGNRC